MKLQSWKVLTISLSLLIAGIYFTQKKIYVSSVNYLKQQYRSFIGNPLCNDADSIIIVDNNYRWVKINCNANFAPRDGAGLVVFKDSMRLIGGWNPNDKINFPLITNNEVWSSADGQNWINSKPNTFTNNLDFNEEIEWSGRHTGGCLIFQNEIFLMGGDANQGYYQSDIWSTSDAINWNVKTNHVPWGPRVLFYSFVFKNKIWILGGQTLPQFAKADEKFYSDCWSSTDGTNWIQELKDTEFEPRGMIIGSVIFNNKVWLIGGGTYDTPKNPDRKFFNDIWVSEDGKKWKNISKENLWNPRQYHSIIVWDNKIWILGGYSKDGNMNDVWYSSDGYNWTQLGKVPWSKRHATHVTTFKDGLWVLSGSSMTSDVWKLEKMKK